MTKKKEVIIPEIITNVISKCDDLITQAMEREYSRFTKLNESYKTWLSGFEVGHKFRYDSVTSFLQSITGKYKVGGTVEYYCLIYSHPNRGEYNQESFNKWFNNYKEEYKINQTWKLTQSMMKHLSIVDKLSSDVRISKTPKGFYMTLGVNQDATSDQIRKAYYTLSRKHHPDKTRGDDTIQKKVIEAYETLSDSGKRARYDMLIGRSGGSTSKRLRKKTKRYMGGRRRSQRRYKKKKSHSMKRTSYKSR
jgi:hypothetical protein